MDVPALAPVPVCAAPFTSMEFDPTGSVLACCANTVYALGRVGQGSLREIWRGPRVQRLRDAVAQQDFTLGCTICSHRIRHNGAELPMRAYQQLAWDPGELGWPQRLSFSLHNTCNLECIMCGADRSSKIRSHRAGLPPLPHVYGPEFFDEIEEFLAQCRVVDFIGGEPFLIREHWTIWDRLAQVRPDARCSVTTNGTVWNDRVEDVLERFDTDIRISLDARDPAIFEAIRVGSDFGEVMVNFGRFLDYSRSRGTSLAVSFSLIGQNWAELAGMLVWGEQLGVPITVQTVLERDFGVQHLPDAELHQVLRTFQEQGETIAPLLELNREVWDRQILMIETELARRAAGERVEPCFDAPAPWNASGVDATITRWSPEPGAPADGSLPAEALEYLRQWDLDPADAGELWLDDQGHVVEVVHHRAIPEAVEVASCPTVEAVLDAWCRDLHGELWVIEELPRPSHLVSSLGVSGVHRDGAGSIIRLLTLGAPGGGRRILVFSDAESRPKPVAVSLSDRRSRRSARP